MPPLCGSSRGYATKPTATGWCRRVYRGYPRNGQQTATRLERGDQQRALHLDPARISLLVNAAMLASEHHVLIAGAPSQAHQQHQHRHILLLAVLRRMPVHCHFIDAYYL